MQAVDARDEAEVPVRRPRVNGGTDEPQVGQGGRRRGEGVHEVHAHEHGPARETVIRKRGRRLDERAAGPAAQIQPGAGAAVRYRGRQEVERAEP